MAKNVIAQMISRVMMARKTLFTTYFSNCNTPFLLSILHKGNPPVSFAVLFLLILMPDANSLHTRGSKRPSQKARYVSCTDIEPK